MPCGTFFFVGSMADFFFFVSFFSHYFLWFAFCFFVFLFFFVFFFWVFFFFSIAGESFLNVTSTPYHAAVIPCTAGKACLILTKVLGFIGVPEIRDANVSGCPPVD